MKLEIMGFNQRSLCALGLDASDAILLRWFVDYQNTSKMKSVTTPEGAVYFWVNMKKPCDDIPILTKNARWMAGRFNKLVEAGVLYKYEVSAGTGKKSCFRLNDDIYFALTDYAQAMSVKTDMGTENEGAMSVKGDIAMSVKGDMPNNLNKTTEIYIRRDNPPTDNNSSEPDKSAPNSDVFLTLPLNGGKAFVVHNSDVEEWQKLYPATDAAQEFRSMLAWCKANPTRLKTEKGINRFINGWLERHQNKGTRTTPAAAPALKKIVNNADFDQVAGGEVGWV